MFENKARGLRAVAAVSVAVIGLSACSSGSKAAGPAPRGPTGVVKIGFLGALSGPDAQLGVDMANGEVLAVDQYDATDPKVPVGVDLVNSQAAASPAALGAHNLVRDRVLAVIGPGFSAEATAADPILEQARIPDVSPSATDASLAEHGWRYFHRVVADDRAQGRADGDYLVRTLHARSVGVVDDGSAYGSGVAAAVDAEVRADGAAVPVSAQVDPAASDYGSTVASVLAVHPDAVFFGGYYAAAGRLVEQLRAAGYRGVFMSDAGADDPRFVTAAGGGGGSGGGGAQGAYVSCACAPVGPGRPTPSFYAAYESTIHAPPGLYSAEAYDATNFVLAAVAAGATTPVAINDYLASHSYQGITKTIRFLPDGNLYGGLVYIYRVEGAKITPVGTSS